jgi:hypothetical protein
VKIGQAKAIAGTLGYPSKMPGTSYGISAHKCLTGGKLATIPGSVCHGCYAMKGHYEYGNVRVSHARRLKGLQHPQWVDAMVTLLANAGSGYHRWHDSGDLQSVNHLGLICEVARRTPRIRHWLPTRELKMVQDYAGTIPPNLVIRVSATMIDGAATKAWPLTSTVHTAKAPDGARTCPAPKQGNACGSCRACWNPNIPQISYHKH